VPTPFLPHLTDIQYRDFFHSVVVETFSQGYWNAMSGDGPAIVNAAWSIQDALVRVINELAFHGNFWEQDRTQLYDVASNTDQLVVNSAFELQTLQNIDQNIFLLAQRDFSPEVLVNLDPLTTQLQSINNNVATIMGAVAGGSDVGFSQVVRALDAENFTAQSFLENFDAHMRVLESQLTQVAAGGASDDLSKAILEVGTYTAKQQDTQNLLGNAYAAADLTAQQKLADNTQAAAATDALFQLLSQSSQADSDEYMDWVVSSGLLAKLTPVAAKLGKGILKALGGQVGGATAIFGLSELDVAFNEGKITHQLTDHALWALGRGSEWVGKLADKWLSVGEDVVKKILPAFEEFFSKRMDTMLQESQRITMALGEIGPNEGYVKAGVLLTQAAKLGMQAHHTAEILELVPFMKHLGLNQITAFMSDMAGFGTIAAQTWGAATGAAVGRPAGYEINALTRSKLPSEGLLEQAVQRRAMSIADYSTLLAFHGYTDNYIALNVDTVWRNPSLREILLLVQDTPIDESTVVTLLRDAGYAENLITIILPALMRKRTLNERNNLVGEVRANLREGFISEDDAKLYFEQVGLAPDEQELSLQTARLAYRRERIGDSLAIYKQQYQDGLIDDSDFVLGIQAYGLTANRVAVEHSAVTSKRFAKVAATEEAESKGEIRKQQGLLVSAMREAFQHGFIDANQFEQALVHGGISDGTARATVELERVKLEGRALTVRSAEAARLLQKEITLREQTFVEMFRKKLINNLQLGQFLLGSGIPAAVVNAIVERELLRARPTGEELLKSPAGLKAKELFTLAKAKLQVEFAKSAIEANKYLQQLVAIGVDQDVAAATVALEVARRGAEKQPPAPATATSKSLTELRAKVEDALSRSAQTDQTTAALEDVLSRLGLVEEVIDALVAQANEQQAAAAAAQPAEV
jgi:hypothetical protein